MKKTIFIISALSLTLNGCIPVVVTAVGGTAMVQHKKISAHLSDSNIEYTIDNKIFENKDLYANNRIIVTVYHGSVLLVGQVINEDYHQQAINIAKNIEGVDRVYDQLTSGKPISFTQQTKDAAITTSIKARILANVGTGTIVITENGVVYLMGTLTKEDADQATDIARSINGVSKVVQIFSYITEPSNGDSKTETNTDKTTATTNNNNTTDTNTDDNDGPIIGSDNSDPMTE